MIVLTIRGYKCIKAESYCKSTKKATLWGKAFYLKNRPFPNLKVPLRKTGLVVCLITPILAGC